MSRKASGEPADVQELALIDDDRKAELLGRLNRIEGQVRGLKGMIEAERIYREVTDLVYKYAR